MKKSVGPKKFCLKKKNGPKLNPNLKAFPS